jgi:hypothetical protein
MPEIVAGFNEHVIQTFYIFYECLTIVNFSGIADCVSSTVSGQMSRSGVVSWLNWDVWREEFRILRFGFRTTENLLL